MNKKLGLHPILRGKNPQKTRSPEAGGMSQEGTAWRLTAVSSTCQLRMAQNSGQMRLVRSSTRLWRFSMVFLNTPKEVDFLNQKTEKTQGIQRRFLDFLYQKTWIFSTSSKRKPQLHRSLGGQSLALPSPALDLHFDVDPLISWQVAVENSPFSIIYFDDLPNLSQKSLKMVIFQFANCYSSHYQRLCLKRPIRSNHTQVQTGTQMRPSIFLCDIPHLMGEDTQLSTDEKNDEGFNKQPDNHFYTGYTSHYKRNITSIISLLWTGFKMG